MNTTWRREITEQMSEHEESWENVESCTLPDKELDRKFDSGFGGENGSSFTLWTAKRVYFPTCYDGAEWCSSVARNPDNVATDHIGG